MEGSILKAKILKIEPVMTKVANKLGISKQALDSLLSSKDVKSGLIERISAAYNIPVSQLYGEEPHSPLMIASGSQSKIIGRDQIGLDDRGIQIILNALNKQESEMECVSKDVVALKRDYEEALKNKEQRIDKLLDMIDRLTDKLVSVQG